MSAERNDIVEYEMANKFYTSFAHKETHKSQMKGAPSQIKFGKEPMMSLINALFHMTCLCGGKFI